MTFERNNTWRVTFRSLAIPQQVPFLEFFPFRQAEGPFTGAASTLETRETLRFYIDLSVCWATLSCTGCLENVHGLTSKKGCSCWSW